MLKTFFPNAVMLGLTATAQPAQIEKLEKTLSMSDCVIVKASPNRRNVFLSVYSRLSNN